VDGLESAVDGDCCATWILSASATRVAAIIRASVLEDYQGVLAEQLLDTLLDEMVGKFQHLASRRRVVGVAWAPTKLKQAALGFAARATELLSRILGRAGRFEEVSVCGGVDHAH
jgi:hypothetical protein